MTRHWLKYLVVAMLMLVPVMVAGQRLSSYALTVDTTTFNSIVTTGTALSFNNVDDGYATVTLPFAIGFGESSFAAGTPIACSANGFLQLGSSSTSGTTAIHINETDCYINAILREDGHLNRHEGAGAYCRYDATAGTFTIEYHLLGRYDQPYGVYSYQIVFHDNSTIELVYDTVDLGGDTSCFLATFMTDGPHGDRAYITDRWASPVFSSSTFAFRPTSNLPAHGLRYTLTPPPAACPRPISVAASSVQNNGFYISWVDTADASRWLVRVVERAADSVVYYNDVTTYPVSITGLEANTDYTVSVASLCANGDTSAFRTAVVHTQCEYISAIPYTMGFEVADGVAGTGDMGSNAFIDCWHRLNSGGAYVGIPFVAEGASARTGSRGLEWNTMDLRSHLVVLPGIDTTAHALSDLYLGFWARVAYPDFHYALPRIQVGVMTDPEDSTTFEQVDVIDVGDSAVWEEYAIPLSGYTGSGIYVALRSVVFNSSWHAYLDDFALYEAPDCREVVELTASEVTDSTINIHWTEIGGASSWLVELTSMGTTLITQTVNDTHVSFAGLTANTQYTVRVAAHCLLDTGLWRAITVSTQCTPLDTLPYYYNFEDSPTGGGSVGTCWSHLGARVVTYAFDPNVSYCYGCNHTPDGNKVLSWEYLDSYHLVILPSVDSDRYPINSLRLRFWAKPSSTYLNYPSFQVGVITNSFDSSTFQPIDTVDIDTRTARWQEYVVSLASYSGAHGRVAIRSNARHTYLDDFTLEPNPTCHPPEGLSAMPGSSAGDVVVSWTETNAATTWQMVMVGRGESADTCNTVVTVYDHEVLLQPDADTSYDIYVRSICQEGDTSEWSSPLHLQTSHQVDMDTLGSTTLITCHSLICDPGGADEPYGNNDHSTLYVYPGSRDSVLAFWGTINTDALDYLLIYEGIGTDGNLLWSPPTYNSYTNETIPNTISRTGPITLVWHSDYGAGRDGFALNVRCLRRSDCPRPTDFTLVSSYTDTVRVAWHDTASIGNYQLCYVPVDADPYAGVDTVVSVEDTAYAFTNLLRDSAYDIYVRSDCGNEQSWWVGPITVIPGTIFMGTSGSDEVTACSFTVYDDGGPMRLSSENADYQLTIHALDPDSALAIHGSTATNGNHWDYLRIYDGDDTTGALLWQTSRSHSTLSEVQEVIPTILSSSNSITLVWHTNFAEACEGFELHVDCITPPTCSYVSAPRVANITSTSVLADWNVNTFPLDIEPAYYEVRLMEGDATIRVDTTSTHPYWVSGLSPLRNYSILVRSVCEYGDRSPWDIVTFATTCMGGDTAEITGGSSAITTNTFPTYTQSAYSYTQMLYPSTQVGRGGTIASIAYHTADSCPPRNVCLYMGEVDRSTLASPLGHIPLSQLQLVYTGTFGGSANSWVDIHLDSLFHYSGMGNIVVAFDDNTGSITLPATFYASDNGQSIHWRSSTDINPAAPGPAVGTSIQQNDIRFIMACDSALACLPPNPIVQSITAHGATLSWTPGLGETAWHIAHRAVDDTVWTIDAVGWHNTTYTITGLDANTQYVFRVAAACSTPLASFVWGHTDCDPQSIPFSVDFETWTPYSSVPYCWHRGSNSPTVVSTSAAHSGNNVLYMYSTSADYSYIVLPLTATPIDSLQLSFWMRKPNSYHTHEIIVGVIADPSDISTFQPLDTVGCSFVSIWEPFEIPLDSYTGTGGRIAILSPDGIRSDPYIDDIEVSYISPCPRPREVYADHLTPTTATLHWNSTSTNNHEIEYGPSGFAHGSGTTVTTTGNSVVLTGLTISMPYDVYVRSICTPDTSQWSFVYTFHPSCDLIDNLPWSDNLESYPPGDNTTGSDFIPCWNRLNNGTNFGGIPTVWWTSYNHTSGGSKSLYWYNNTTLTTYGDYQCVVLPGIDTAINPINTIRLRFWAQPSSGSPTLFLGIMADPYDITTFQCVDTVTLGSNRQWSQIECPFALFEGRGCHPAIMALRPTTPWEAYLDDFVLEVAPCSVPNRFRSTGNTASTITLNWHERGTATQWQVAVETSLLTPPTPDTLITSHPITIADLVSGTEYYFYVRSICGDGDTSPWSDALVRVPGSWDMRANQVDTIRMCGGIIYDDGGPADSYSNNQNSLIVIYPDAANSLVSVSGTVSIAGIRDCLTIYDGVGRQGTTLLNYFGYNNNRSFEPIVSSNGPITIYFYADGSSNSDGFAINVNCISRTCRVANVRLDSTEAPSDTQLAVSWDTNGADLYEVAWGPVGFTPTAGMATTYTNRITITGLSRLTSYDVCVRSICSGGMDTGSWTRATLQTTLCDYVSQHYSYNGTISATNNNTPLGISIYGYSYVQTLIDSAQMAGLTDPINAFAFSTATATNGYYYNHIDVYMANVPESDLSGGFIHPDSNHLFRLVIADGDLRYNTVGWQTHKFDSPFIWDGHSNVLFAVNRRHGLSSNGYAASFNTHTTSDIRTRYINQSGTAYDPATVTGGTASHDIGDLKFMTCGAASCPMPNITNVLHSDENAMVTWAGDGSSYEVSIKESSAPHWPSSNIAVTGSSYTFTGLLPSTDYLVRVRQNCNADNFGYSEWDIRSFTTDPPRCVAPYNITVTNITNASATVDWTPTGHERLWDIHIWFSGGIDSIYTVNRHPVTIGGFTANTTYQVSVRPRCDLFNNIIGDWGDTISFTTAVCPDVTDLSASVDGNSVTLRWSLIPPTIMWTIEYGFQGFDLGTGTTITTGSTSYTISDLMYDMPYDFHVRALCGTQWQSENWTSVTATTEPQDSATCDPVADLTASNVTESSALLTWTPGETGDAWEVVLSSATGITLSEASTTEHQYPLGSLTPSTTYVAKVRTVCGDDIYSTSTSTSFTTASVGIDPIAEPVCTIHPNPIWGSRPNGSNPPNVTVTVSGISGKVRIAVLDMTGRSVYSETFNCSSECEKHLDIKGLAKGTYIVYITSESYAPIVKKLIVE